MLIIAQDSIPRGIIEVEKCLSIKGAEDVVNKPHAFEISTNSDSMFYIADTDKEKVCRPFSIQLNSTLRFNAELEHLHLQRPYSTSRTPTRRR